MFEKRWLHAVDELGKLIEVVEYLSVYKPEIPVTGVRAVSYQLICLMGYSIGEKNKTHLTQSKTLLKKEVQIVVCLRIY